MAARMLCLSSTTIRFELKNSDPNGGQLPHHKDPLPRLSFSKPSLVVRTESNVHREIRRKKDPPCVICKGSGRVNCEYCCGRGRTNYVDMEMLPKGEWPKWCWTCGGSGLSHCPRCLGTGEYRDIMGFRFMNIDANQNQIRGNQNRRGAADLYEE